MLAPLVILPLMLAPIALASPVDLTSLSQDSSPARTLELVGVASPKQLIDGKFDMEMAKRDCVYIQEKYARRSEHERKVEAHRQRRAGRKAKRAGVTSVPVTNIGNLIYTGPLSIGTPPQQLPFALDTGSADLWIQTGGCANPAGCLSKTFDKTTSSTYNETGQQVYSVFPLGAVAGTLSYDTVQIGDLKVENQSFNAVSQIAPGLFQGPLPFTGILGLTFSKMSNLPAPTLLDNLIARHELSESKFGLYLSDSGSSLTLGGVDSTKFTGSLVSFPVMTSTYWDIALQTIQVGSVSVWRSIFGSHKTGLRTAIDSGTSFSYLPMDAAAAVYSAIPGAQLGQQFITPLGPVQYWNYPCDSYKPVKFQFQGDRAQYQIAAKDFSQGAAPEDVVGPGRCVGGIMGIDAKAPDGQGGESPIAILGNQLLKSYYSVYNMADPNHDGQPSVAFATAA